MIFNVCIFEIEKKSEYYYYTQQTTVKKKEDRFHRLFAIFCKIYCVINLIYFTGLERIII